MALIDVRERRSATVVATTETVVARVSEKQFTELANKYPRIWRLLAIEIAKRLRERGSLVLARNEKSQIFIGSSRESLDVARKIEGCITGEDVVTRVWSDGVFKASKTSIEALENTAKIMDFAVLVFSADDEVFSRDEEFRAPRDNVVFELGLFMGALERERTFVILPRGSDLKIPSDLLGVTPLAYEQGLPETLAERLAPPCDDLKKIIAEKGPK
jgi:predicted nucleotide-binding protein